MLSLNILEQKVHKWQWLRFARNMGAVSQSN